MADLASASVLSRQAAKQLDRWTIDHGTPGLELMERAGACIAAAVADHFGPRASSDDSSRVLVLAGKGNNGGDGLVVARLLADQGWECTVALCHGEPATGTEAVENLERWRERGGSEIGREAALALLEAGGRGDDTGVDVVLDALYGIGLDRPLGSDDIAVVRTLADSGLPVVAVDVPSGLCADTGKALGAAVSATLTVALGSAKPGLFVGSGPDYAGTVVVADIGLAPLSAAGIAAVGSLIDHRSLAPIVPSRRTTAHKGDGGHVLVCGGSAGKTGAVLLAARAALRAGAGLVTMAVPASVAASVDASLWEAMTLAIADDGHGETGSDAWRAIEPEASRFAAAALGPGLGLGDGAAALVRAFIEDFPGRLVLDADALTLLAADADGAQRLRARNARAHGAVVLTPHPGEMGRLLSTASRSVQADRIAAVRACAARYPGTVVVLKGAGTLVATGETLGFNTSGNPGMATAGMGDVLAGTIAALAAVVPDLADAVSLAVHSHGAAADLLAGRIEGPGYFASEVADALPEALGVLRAEAGS